MEAREGVEWYTRVWVHNTSNRCWLVAMTDRRASLSRRQIGRLCAGTVLGSMPITGKWRSSETTGPGDTIWKQSEIGKYLGFPTVVDGMLYLRSNNGIHALDSHDGRKHWHTNYPKGELSVVNGVIYSESNGGLTALDESDGERLWELDEISSFPHPGPIITDGVAYAGDFNAPGVFAISMKRREKVWHNTDPDGPVRTKPTFANGTVYATSLDHNMYAIDADSGETKWRNTDPKGRMWTLSTVANGTVYLGGVNPSLYAIDTGTGETLWHNTDLPSKVRSSPTAIDGTVYAATYHDGLYAIDADTGTIIWKNIPGEQVSAPTVADGVVYTASSEGTVYALTSDTGKILWTNSDIGTQPGKSPIVVDGVLYVTDVATVYAIDAGVEGSSDGSRVELGTLGHHHTWAKHGGTEPPSITIKQARLVQTVENTRRVTVESERDIANLIDGVVGEGLVNGSAAGVTETVEDPDLVVGRRTAPVFDLEVTNPQGLPDVVDAKVRVYVGDRLLDEQTFSIDATALRGGWPDGRERTYEQFIDLPEDAPFLEWLAADLSPIRGEYPVFPAYPDSVVELVIGDEANEGDSYRFDLRDGGDGMPEVVNPQPLTSLTRQTWTRGSDTTYLPGYMLKSTLSIGFIPVKNDAPLVGYQFEDDPDLIPYAEQAAKIIQRLFPVINVNVAVVEQPISGMSTLHPKPSGPIANEARRRLQASLDRATTFTVHGGCRYSRPPLTDLDITCAVVPQDSTINGSSPAGVPWPNGVTSRRPPGMVSEVGLPAIPAHEAGHYFLGADFYPDALALEGDPDHISRNVYSTGYDLENGEFDVLPGSTSIMGPPMGWIDSATYQGLIDSDLEVVEVGFGEPMIDKVNSIYSQIKEGVESITTLAEPLDTADVSETELLDQVDVLESQLASLETDLAAVRSEITHYREGGAALPPSFGSRLEATAESTKQVASGLREIDTDLPEDDPGTQRILETAPDRLDAIGEAVADRADEYDPGWMFHVSGMFRGELEATFNEYPTLSDPTGFERGKGTIVARDPDGVVLAKRQATTSLEVLHHDGETDTTEDVIVGGVPLPRAATEVEIHAEFASSDGAVTTSIDPVTTRLQYAIERLPKRAFATTETRGNLLDRVDTVGQLVSDQKFDKAGRELGEMYRILSKSIKDEYRPDEPGEISKSESFSIVATHRDRLQNDADDTNQRSVVPWIVGGLSGAVAAGYLLKRRIRSTE